MYIQIVEKADFRLIRSAGSLGYRLEILLEIKVTAGRYLSFNIFHPLDTNCFYMPDSYTHMDVCVYPYNRIHAVGVEANESFRRLNTLF